MNKSEFQTYQIFENSLKQQWILGPTGFNEKYSYDGLVLWEFINDKMQLRLITIRQNKDYYVLQSFSSCERLVNILKGKKSEVLTFKIDSYVLKPFEIQLENVGSLYLNNAYGYYTFKDTQEKRITLYSSDKDLKQIINSRTYLADEITAKNGEIPESIQLILNQYHNKQNSSKTKSRFFAFIAYALAVLFFIILLFSILSRFKLI